MVRRKKFRARLPKTVGFAVLFGASGTKSFKTLKSAKTFAKKVARKKPRSEVAIDRLHPFSQSPHSTIQEDIINRPKKKRR